MLMAHAQPDVVMDIPVDKVGLIIGRKGQRIQEIRDKSGAQIRVKDDKVHLRGTPEQCEKAKKIIEEILLPRDHQDRNSSPAGFKLVQDLFLPETLMGHVIGKGRENINRIATNTGVSLKVRDNKFYIKAETEKDEKLAVREIKALACIGLQRSQLKVPFTKFVYVDSAQLDENHEFRLSQIQLPFTNSDLGETYFKLQLLEHPLPEESYPGFINTDSLKEKILEVLKRIYAEKDEDEVKVDMWCHFGHAYITKVDEDELEDTFTLNEVEDKVQNAGNKSWKPFFKEGVEEMEVEAITSLPSNATEEDIRHDFSFYTPSCRNVRVKTWLIEGNSGQEGSEDEANMAFCPTSPVPVKNILTRVKSDEQGAAADTPIFHICSQFHHRMKVDILIPAKGLDCRLSIRTCKNYVPKSPQDEEEDKILKSYLMGMKIEGNRLILPPASQLQEGFDLYFERRSLRKTYQYEMEGEEFSLTVCKDQATNVDPCDFEHSDVNQVSAKTDIHLHCDEWDRVLDEGNWEPQQIVAKLPKFLQFLRKVQRNVSP